MHAIPPLNPWVVSILRTWLYRWCILSLPLPLEGNSFSRTTPELGNRWYVLLAIVMTFLVALLVELFFIMRPPTLTVIIIHLGW